MFSDIDETRNGRERKKTPGKERSESDSGIWKEEKKK